jgi:hypothetical protein
MYTQDCRHGCAKIFILPRTSEFGEAFVPSMYDLAVEKKSKMA